jgi:CheY-like chemotaxis protein
MNGEPMEILLVDDNDDDIIIIQEAFSEAKLMKIRHRVRNGEEALAYLRQEGEYKVARRPELILLDINMPRMNGFEVLEFLKGDANLCSLPVIMLTMSSREEDILRSYRSGACSYICKPINLDEFVGICNEFARYWTLVSRIPFHISSIEH